MRADPMPGYEIIPPVEALREMPESDLARLRAINYELSGGETAEEVNRIRELDRMYSDPQYWKDVPRHALAAMKSMWKTLDPETGESTWNFGAAPPPFEMVERGLMTHEEWMEMKEVADRVEKEKPSRPGIIDETIAMRALMTEVANMFRDERVEPPEYASEAMERSMELQEATEKQMGLDPAVGFPQRFGQMFGFMAGQIPSPKSLTEVAGQLVKKIAPSVTKRIPKAIKAGVGAPLEFMDPTIRPALSTYMTGAAAGTGLIYGVEAAAERKLKELEEKLEEENPEEFARGGQVSKALMKLREVGERTLKERVAERKAGMEDWTRDYREDFRKITGIDDPFTPADPGGPIIGHPRLEDYPPGYFPDDEVAAEMRRLYKAVEDIGPHTGGQVAGKQLIEGFPEDANLGELLDLSRRVADVEEIEWQHSVEVGQAERKAAELAKWGDPGELDPHAFRENQAIELTDKVITDNEEHIMAEMRSMADEANRDPRMFQQITEEDSFFDPISNAPRGGADWDDFLGSFGNFGPEVDAISNLWRKALGDEFKYQKIARRIKQIQEEGL